VESGRPRIIRILGELSFGKEGLLWLEGPDRQAIVNTNGKKRENGYIPD